MSSFPTFRRTKLEYDDLANASDDEMNNLLSLDDDKTEDDVDLLNSNGNHSMGAAIIDINGDNTAPILQLDGQESSSTMTRSKSVRFQEPEEISNRRLMSDENDKLRQVKVQVEDVKGVMRDNVSRLLDREAQLDNLSERSDQLHQSSDIYRQSSDMLRRKLYWRQMRTKLVLTGVSVICLFLILVPLITKFV